MTDNICLDDLDNIIKENNEIIKKAKEYFSPLQERYVTIFVPEPEVVKKPRFFGLLTKTEIIERKHEHIPLELRFGITGNLNFVIVEIKYYKTRNWNAGIIGMDRQDSFSIPIELFEDDVPLGSHEYIKAMLHRIHISAKLKEG